MMPDDLKFLATFPFLFVGLWLIVTTILGLLSGWFTLQQRFGPPNDERLLTLRAQSGSMGVGVALQSVLWLTAHKSGLGVGIWRLFGPFQRPFLVPWHEIEAKPTKTLFTPMVNLSLGKPPAGSLRISARSWSRLVEAARPVAGAALGPGPAVGRASVARGMFIEWLATTALAASFFYFASRYDGSGSPIPLEACIGLPGAVLGLAQLFRYASHR